MISDQHCGCGLFLNHEHRKGVYGGRIPWQSITSAYSTDAKGSSFDVFPAEPRELQRKGMSYIVRDENTMVIAGAMPFCWLFSRPLSGPSASRMIIHSERETNVKPHRTGLFTSQSVYAGTIWYRTGIFCPLPAYMASKDPTISARPAAVSL